MITILRRSHSSYMMKAGGTYLKDESLSILYGEDNFLIITNVRFEDES